jgi:hypothetical protein
MTIVAALIPSERLDVRRTWIAAGREEPGEASTKLERVSSYLTLISKLDSCSVKDLEMSQNSTQSLVARVGYSPASSLASERASERGDRCLSNRARLGVCGCLGLLWAEACCCWRLVDRRLGTLLGREAAVAALRMAEARRVMAAPA